MELGTNRAPTSAKQEVPPRTDPRPTSVGIEESGEETETCGEYTGHGSYYDNTEMW